MGLFGSKSSKLLKRVNSRCRRLGPLSCRRSSEGVNLTLTKTLINFSRLIDAKVRRACLRACSIDMHLQRFMLFNDFCVCLTRVRWTPSLIGIITNFIGRKFLGSEKSVNLKLGPFFEKFFEIIA